LVPITVERGQRDDLDVRLLRPAEIPPGFVYVPAGPIRVGGDPQAIRPLARKRYPVEGFFIAAKETTCEDFAAFLSDIPPQDARALLPRGGPRQGYAALFWPKDGGGFAFPSTWPPDRPVTGITFEAAVRYAGWRAAREQRPYRLPTEIEWEKAARGADGRGYPWGEADPAGRANIATGSDPAQAKPVGSTPGDVSIFGVFDLVGNASEWTSSQLDTRLLHRIVRGGSYMPATDLPRCASRFPTETGNPPEHTGMRLACDLP
jgi:serine/threonine-protein kinase